MQEEFLFVIGREITKGNICFDSLLCVDDVIRTTNEKAILIAKEATRIQRRNGAMSEAYHAYKLTKVKDA